MMNYFVVCHILFTSFVPHVFLSFRIISDLHIFLQTNFVDKLLCWNITSNHRTKDYFEVG